MEFANLKLKRKYHDDYNAAVTSDGSTTVYCPSQLFFSEIVMELVYTG